MAPLLHHHHPPPGQRPRHAHDDLPLAEAPEVDGHADEVVQARVGGLVEQQRGEGAERVDEEAGFDAGVRGCERFCQGAGRRRGRSSWRGRGGGGVGFWCCGVVLRGVVVGGCRGGGVREVIVIVVALVVVV